MPERNLGSDPSFWIALYGAALSSLLGIFELLKHRRRIAVKCRTAIGLSPYGNIPLLSITVVNKGHRPITINAAGFILMTGNEVTHLKANLPKKLEDGEVLDINIDLDTMRDMIGGLTNIGDMVRCAFVRDVEGKKHRASLPIEVIQMTTEAIQNRSKSC